MSSVHKLLALSEHDQQSRLAGDTLSSAYVSGVIEKAERKRQLEETNTGFARLQKFLDEGGGYKAKITYDSKTGEFGVGVAEKSIEEQFNDAVRSGAGYEELYRKFGSLSGEIDSLRQRGVFGQGTPIPPMVGTPIQAAPTVQAPAPQMSLAPGQPEATEWDALGYPKGFKIPKPSAAQEKRNVETSELAGQTKNIIELFNKARKEMADVSFMGTPAGSEGIAGRMANQKAILKGKAGYSPTVNTFQDSVAAFATIQAKAAGEQRPTDQDIVRFANALLNLKNNDAENALKLGTILSDIKAKGQSISWAEPLILQFEQTTGQSVDFGDQSNNTEMKQTTSGIKYRVRQ
jgi:hypothetical protein